MYCNQPFCGSGFSSGQYGSYDQIAQNINVMGEGEVISVTLPDGARQYFFKPTIKWWTPPTANNCPLQYNTINDNFNNPYYNTNLGFWFIRSISNSIPPFHQTNTNANPYHQQETTRYSSDYNMNIFNPGYQLKLHNDAITSTTDIHYFYPCLRQYDCTFNFLAKGCAAVQVDTPNVNTCYYDTVYTKPCHCTAIQNNISETPSKMSLDTKNKSRVDFCECHSIDNHHVKSISNIQQKELVPRDEKKKRIKLERNSHKRSQSKAIICECPEIIDKSTVMYTDSGCGGGPQKDVGTQKESQNLTHELKQQLKHDWKSQKAGHSKTKDIDCECSPPPSSAKCTTVEKLNVQGSDRNVGLQECGNKRSNVINAKSLFRDNTDMETWCPISEWSKQRFECSNNNKE